MSSSAAARPARPAPRPSREERRLRPRPGAAHPELELAGILAEELAPGAVVTGVSPGGLATARAVAARLSLPVLPVPVIPLAPPWNKEPAYGAVAFDGSVHLDDDLLRDLELGRRELERAVTRARQILAAERPLRDPVELARRNAAVVDDGRAPAVAVAATALALRNAGADRVVAAVLAGSCRHLSRLAGATDRVVCAGAVR